MLEFNILDRGDLKALADAFKDQADGRELRAGLAKEFRTQTGPIVRRVQAAWRGAPSHGHGTSTRARQGQPSLRSLLARATHSEVRLTGKETGVRIRTDGRRMPSGMKALPSYVEGTKPRWRAPVFGNRTAWAQHDSFPRFYSTVQPQEAQARAAAERAVETVLEKIAKGR